LALKNQSPWAVVQLVCMILRLAILVQYQHMTDRQTNRQMDRRRTTAYIVVAQRSVGNDCKTVKI